MALDLVLFAWLVVFASIGALVILFVVISAIVFVCSCIKWNRWEKKHEKES